jgi:uncharacterized Fe-S radical SAM superfamily protein PflX
MQGTSAATAIIAGTQHRKARIPFARAEQSCATTICNTAPKRSEQGAIKIRVAAVMANHVHHRDEQCDVTSLTALFFNRLKFIVFCDVLSLVQLRLKTKEL